MPLARRPPGAAPSRAYVTLPGSGSTVGGRVNTPPQSWILGALRREPPSFPPGVAPLFTAIEQFAR
jgi:hypothetical protein